MGGVIEDGAVNTFITFNTFIAFNTVKIRPIKCINCIKYQAFA